MSVQSSQILRFLLVFMKIEVAGRFFGILGGGLDSGLTDFARAAEAFVVLLGLPAAGCFGGDGELAAAGGLAARVGTLAGRAVGMVGGEARFDWSTTMGDGAKSYGLLGGEAEGGGRFLFCVRARSLASFCSRA